MSDRQEGEKTGVVAVLREYASADPRTLGLFRVLFGVFMLIDLYRRLPDHVFFYTNEGMLPNHGALYQPMSVHLLSIYHAFSTRGEVLFAFALTALVYVAYLVGYRTRVAQVLALVCLTGLHSRNIMLENGGDVVANLLALWTVFLPLGRRFSVDAVLADRARLRGEMPIPSPFTPDRVPVISIAYAAIFLDLAVIYYFNTVHKDGPPWRDGTSVHYVFWSDRLIQPLGVFLRPYVPLALIKVLSIGTLVMEASITILLLSPFFIRSCRRVAAFMVIALHCGFQTLGHYGLFAFVMMLHAPLLMGPEDWDALARRMRARLPERTLYFDSRRALSRAIAAAISYVDHLGKVTLVDVAHREAPDTVGELVASTGLAVVDGRGVAWSGALGLGQLARALPFGVFVARWSELPLVRDACAALWGRLVSWRSDERAGAPHQGALRPARVPLLGAWWPRGREALAWVFVVGIVSQILVENRKVPALLKPRHQPEVLAAIAQYGRFFQGWSMFAPTPPTDDGRLTVDAVTRSGEHVDPLAGGLPVDFTMAGPREGGLMTQFWYEFHDRIRRSNNARYRQYFHEWLINWHRSERRPADDRIVAYEVFWVYRPTQPPGSQSRLPTQRERIMDWNSQAPPEEKRPGPQYISSPVRGY